MFNGIVGITFRKPWNNFFTGDVKSMHMQEMLDRLHLLEDKIRYAERKFTCAVLEQENPLFIKSLKVRIDNLNKERSLYHDHLQSYKSSVPYLSPLYKKIESIVPYQPSRYV